MFSEELWDNFVSNTWGRCPAIYKKADYTPLTESDFKKVIQKYFSQAVQGKFSNDIRIYANDRSISKSEHALLLNIDINSITDFKSFVLKAKSILNSNSFGVIINDVGNFEPSIQREVEKFLTPLVRRVGLPFRETEIGIFGGDYLRTPFGIHRDLGNDNFTFGIVGEKRFLFWPPEYFASDIMGTKCGVSNKESIYCDIDVYERFKGDAISLTVCPGEILYWPDWWHTADMEFEMEHLTLSLGLWSEVNLATLCADFVRCALEERLKNRLIVKGFCHPDQELPNFLEELLALLKRLNDEDSVAETTKSWWKNRVANQGFATFLDD